MVYHLSTPLFCLSDKPLLRRNKYSLHLSSLCSDEESYRLPTSQNLTHKSSPVPPRDTFPKPPLGALPTVQHPLPSEPSALCGENTSLVFLRPLGETRSLRATGAHSTRGRKSAPRPWCSRKTKKKMVLGVDISLYDSVSMALCTLVGRPSYKNLCRTDLAY
jgi:hypothetical protein